MKVVSGKSRIYQNHEYNSDLLGMTQQLYAQRGLKEKQVEWTRKAKIRTAELLAPGQAQKALLWPTSGLVIALYFASPCSTQPQEKGSLDVNN